MAKFEKGQVPHNIKEKTPTPCKQCGVIMMLPPWKVARGWKFCSKECSYKGRVCKGLFEKGHPDLVPKESRGHTKETRAKMKEFQRKNRKIGADHPNWRGGNHTERKKEMGRAEYRDWRSAVFTRDNFTCQECGVSGVYVEADHIKPWSLYPELRYSVSNGRTLCQPCHRKTDTWGRRALSKARIDNE